MTIMPIQTETNTFENQSNFIFEGISVAYSPITARALGSMAYGGLHDYEIETLKSAETNAHHRANLVGDIVSFSEGELSAHDFDPQSTIEGLPSVFKEAVYIPKVTMPVSEFADLQPFLGINPSETIEAPALDVFIDDSAHKESAIRIVDLRELTDLDIDTNMLRNGNGKLQARLDNRLAKDIKGLFNNITVHRVLSTKIPVYYAQSSGDKLRAYWRYVETDDKPQTPGYKVLKTVVRLGDCATEGGEEAIYPKLFGFRM
ncbi:MAG: hypothetical protein JWO35_908 [Candidatus Saccharibacteria bacterium]|nr:hypothetical protein [Candidatus Saccharibacteria bacterium]